MTERAYQNTRLGRYVQLLRPKTGGQTIPTQKLAKEWLPSLFTATSVSQQALPRNDNRQGIIIQSPVSAAAIVDINFDADAGSDQAGFELAIGGTLIIDAQTSPANAMSVKSRGADVALRITEMI